MASRNQYKYREGVVAVMVPEEEHKLAKIMSAEAGVPIYKILQEAIQLLHQKRQENGCQSKHI
jgi:hypothetical protein